MNKLPSTKNQEELIRFWGFGMRPGIPPTDSSPGALGCIYQDIIDCVNKLTDRVPWLRDAGGVQDSDAFTILQGQAMDEIKRSNTMIYEALKNKFPEIDTNRRYSSLGDLSNIYIAHRTLAAEEIYPIAQELVKWSEGKSKEVFMQKIDEFKMRIWQCSTLFGLKRQLRKFQSGLH